MVEMQVSIVRIAHSVSAAFYLIFFFVLVSCLQKIVDQCPLFLWITAVIRTWEKRIHSSSGLMVRICSEGQGQKENLRVNYNKASVRKKM